VAILANQYWSIPKSNLHIRDFLLEKKKHDTRTLVLITALIARYAGHLLSCSQWTPKVGGVKRRGRSTVPEEWPHEADRQQRGRRFDIIGVDPRTYIRQHGEGCRDRGGRMLFSLSRSRRRVFSKYSCRRWPTDLTSDFRIPYRRDSSGEIIDTRTSHLPVICISENSFLCK